MQLPLHLLETAVDIKLAFFDIDGTLLDSQGHIHRDLYPAIQLLKGRGIKMAVASGRPFFAARVVIDELGLSDAGMFYTGAHLYDPLKEKTLSECYLTPEAALSIVRAAQELGLYIEAYTSDEFFVPDVTSITEVHAAHLRVHPKVCNLDELVRSKPIAKLLVGVNLVEQGDLLSPLELCFPQQIFARAYLTAYPDWQFASVIAGVATKERAFQQLLTHHQVDAKQVVAFGDAESDMDFLRMAGIGVAMGNANANVRASADWVTKTADQAGVAYAIHQLFGSHL